MSNVVDRIIIWYFWKFILPLWIIFSLYVDNNSLRYDYNSFFGVLYTPFAFKFYLCKTKTNAAISVVFGSGILVNRLVKKTRKQGIFWKDLHSYFQKTFTRLIIRYEEWKKIAKKTGKIIIKITYRWNNWKRFRK